MFNKKAITILLCIIMVVGNFVFSQTIVKAVETTAIGWKQSGATWCYLNSNGAKTVGWVQSGSKWYYLNSKGVMVTGWIQSGGKWYYLNPNGAMATAWIKSANKWYYLNSSGAMATGWIKAGGSWYYLNSSGDMVTGFIQTGPKKYYLYSNGSMALDTTIQGCYLGSDGAVQDNHPTSVTLNKIKDDLMVGKTDNLIASVLPLTATNQSVKWTTSNTEIVTVDSTGKLVAVSEGTAIITVNTIDGNKTASCTISVNPVIKVTALTLNKTTDNLVVGEADTLTVNVSPIAATNQTVTWKSSNEAIISVDNTGKVTAVSAGTATIIVTTADGSKTASCSVSVNPLTTVTAVSLNKITDRIIMGAEDTLIPNVSPTTAINKAVTWSSSNNAIVSVDNAGKVKAVNPGIAIITVTTTDGSKTASCSVSVTNTATAITNVKLNKTTATLSVGAAETLTANVSSTMPTNEAVTWRSSNAAVVAVDNTGKMTAVSVGTAIITAITADVNYMATCNVTVAQKTAATLTFAIDIGHNSQYDTGAVGIRSEDVCNKEVGTRVMEKLTNLGYKVIDCTPVSATSTTNSLQQRCDAANAANADYYVAIHFNIFNGAARGSEIYIGSDNVKAKAQQVLDNITSLGFINRGVKDNSRGLYVLKYTDMPAMLIECAFLDSVSDMDIYNPDTLADAIVNGIIADN